MTTRYIRMSEMKTWKRCRRKWALAYVRNLERKHEDVGAHTVGTFVHAGLEAYYTGLDWRRGVAEAFSASYVDEATEAHRNAFDLAIIMLEGYFEWLATEGADVGLEVVAVEQQIEVPFGNFHGDDVVLTGRLDLQVQDSLGRRMFMDHKTVTSFDQAGRQLQVDDQLLTYSMLLRMTTGEFIDGAIYNMLRKVKRTARSNPPFYQRQEFHFGVEQVRNHYRHVVAAISEMVAAAQVLTSDPSAHHDIAYPNPTKDCSWDCPFLGVCAMHDDGSDLEGVLAEIYKLKEVPVA